MRKRGRGREERGGKGRCVKVTYEGVTQKQNCAAAAIFFFSFQNKGDISKIWIFPFQFVNVPVFRFILLPKSVV